MMAERDRQDLERALKAEPPPIAEEVAKLFNEGSVASQLLGLLLREQEEASIPFLSADLISEDGRLRSIQNQGRLAGRAELLGRVIDLIVEGSQDDRPERE
jgi:hypothetical protein